MDKLNMNLDAKKNQADNKEIQDFFRSKAYLDKPLISKAINQINMVEKKLKKGKRIRSKLKERPIETDLFSFEKQKSEHEENQLLFATNNMVDNNISAANGLMTTSQQIGGILKTKRKAKNLTQKQLAVLAYNDEMQQSLISRIEAGGYKTGFEDVATILKSLGIDLIELIVNTNLNDETN